MKRDVEKFWRMTQEHFFTNEANELDYSDFLDIGVECGLLYEDVYDPKKHGDGWVGDPEEGDPIFRVVKKRRPRR